MAIPYMIAAVGMVLWCRHSDLKRERVGHIAVASVLAFSGLAASAYLADYPALSIVAITAGALGNLAILPVFWTLPAGILSGAAAAGGIAMINALGNVGGFAGPYVVGWLKDTTGSFVYASLVMGVSFLFTGVIALLIGNNAASMPSQSHQKLREAAAFNPGREAV